MPVDAATYLPPHVSQRATKLARDGVDDCRVIATQRLVHHATLGESCTTGRGKEMSTAQLVRQAVALRDTLDDPQTAEQEDQTGGLDIGHSRRMAALMWPRYPRLLPADIDFGELLARLEDGHCAQLSGVPARIRGDSPLKRAGDIGHELGLSGIRKRGGVLELAVDDPYRPGGKDPRVEWRPAKEVRRFAYQDSDQDLTAVITVRIGSWTAESLMRRKKDARISAIEADAAKTEARLRARIKELKAAPPGDSTDLVAHARAAGWESGLVQVIAAAERLRMTGDTP